jgi:hypothetical protein
VAVRVSETVEGLTNKLQQTGKGRKGKRKPMNASGKKVKITTYLHSCRCTHGSPHSCETGFDIRTRRACLYEVRIRYFL